MNKHTKSKNSKFKIVTLISISCITLFIIVTVIGYSILIASIKLYESKKENFLEITYNSLISSYYFMANAIFEDIESRSSVVNALEKSLSKNSEISKEARHKLYELLKPNYANITNRGISQLLIHAPDGKILLEFNDSSGQFTEAKKGNFMVAKRNNNYIEIVGYHDNKTFYGFRYIFALQKENKNLGYLEIDISFKTVKKQMIKAFKKKHLFILDKSLINTKINDFVNKNNTNSQHIPYKFGRFSFIRDKMYAVSDVTNKLNRKIKKEAETEIKNSKPFVLLTNHAGNNYLVTFLPLFNLNKEKFGYIISYEINNNIAYFNLLFYAVILIFWIVILIFHVFIYLLIKKNRQLDKAHQEAESSSLSKSEFLANMSHEIRTPMNGVVGMTSLLIDTDLTAEQKQYVESIRMSGDNLLLIINDILDYSKIEAGKLELECIEFDIVNRLNRLMEVLSFKASEKNLDLIFDSNIDISYMVKGDPGRLSQIITNLVGNAVKFTDKGKITVVMELHSETKSDIFIKFNIQDTGIGIPEYILDKLFEKFTQADSSTSRKFGGTGLGLAISKQLSSLMGGEIGACSKLGEGSTFWFTICLKKMQKVLKEEVSSRILRGKHVLIVDENKSNLEVLERFYKSWGMRTRSTINPKEALQILDNSFTNNDPFDILTTDMEMSVMDGKTLATLIRKDNRFKKMKIMLFTSVGLVGNTSRLKQKGIDGYSVKPLRKNIICKFMVNMYSNDSINEEKVIEPSTAKKGIVNYESFSILVAEDDLINQKVAKGIIKKLGIIVDIVSDGNEAVEMRKKQKYDLIFMDVQMPNLNGYDATKKIREFESENSKLLDEASQPTPNRVPIIAMTAQAMKGDREICIDAGMDDYITKPFTIESISGIFNKWLIDKVK
jgi:signal transduction histidine kinase/CheY-like chemotaxis protein